MARSTIARIVRERSDLLALGLGVGLLFVFWIIGAGKELWFDERFVQVVSSRPLREMIALLRFENNPPFIFFFTHLWQELFGGSPYGLRMVSLLPSVATLIVVWRFTRSVAGRHVAALSVLLTSVAGQVVIQSQELRMYPWLMVWSALALLLAWSYVQRPRTSTRTWLAVVHILGLYTHYTYFFFFIAVTLWLFVMLRLQRWSIIFWTGAVLVAFTPWFFFSLLAKLQHLDTNVGIQRIAAARPEVALLPFRFILPEWFLDGLGWTLVRLAGSIVILVGIVSFIFLWRRWRDRRGLGLLASITLVTIGLLTAAGIVVSKYATCLLVPMIIIVAWGIVRVPVKFRNFLAGVLLVTASATSFRQVGLPYVTYAAAATVIEQAERSGDVVFIYPFNDAIAFRPVYRGQLDVQGFFPLKNPVDVQFLDILRYNFRVTLTQQNVERLDAYVGSARRVWFLYDVPPSAGYWHGDLIVRWFEQNGFHATLYRDIFKNVPPLLIRYDR